MYVALGRVDTVSTVLDAVGGFVLPPPGCRGYRTHCFV
jgi:hypothetical protein